METIVKLPYRHSEEAKAKMRKAAAGRKGRPVSAETRAKISAANKGKVRSEETRRKMSEARKGVIISPETRRKMSEMMKARPRPEGFTMKGRKHSAESRQKMSLVQIGRQATPETIAKRKLAFERSKADGSYEKIRKKISESHKRLFLEKRAADPNYRRHTPEALEKLRLHNLGRKHTPETKAKMKANIQARKDNGSFAKTIEKRRRLREERKALALSLLSDS